jgi:hypothetical protein
MSIFSDIQADAAEALYEICYELGISLTLQLSGGSAVTVYCMPEEQTTTNLIEGGSSGDAMTELKLHIPKQTNFSAATAAEVSNALVTYESIQYRVMSCTADPSRAVFTLQCEAFAG